MHYVKFETIGLDFILYCDIINPNTGYFLNIMNVDVNRVALLLALMLKRSNKTKGRVSDKTLKLISQRERLKRSFLANLQAALDDFNIQLIDLDRGGFAICYTSIFEGIPCLTAKKFIPKKERVALSLDEIFNELGMNGNDLEDEDSD